VMSNTALAPARLSAPVRRGCCARLLAEVFPQPYLVVQVGAEHEALRLQSAGLVRFFGKAMGRNAPQFR
jgi:hypothetical protein